MTILEVKNLSCTRQSKIIFDDISFSLNSGEVLLIQGENGSGKSSLLRLIAGLATPSFGEIVWDQNYQNAFHYVGHSNGIKLGLTIEENLQLMEMLACHPERPSLKHAGINSAPKDLHAKQEILRPLRGLRMTANFLSAGQKRKLALAKLFLIPKPVWILDEPLTALDADAQKIFLSELKNHLANGGMALISSHHEIEVEGGNKKLLTLVS